MMTRLKPFTNIHHVYYYCNIKGGESLLYTKNLSFKIKFQFPACFIKRQRCREETLNSDIKISGTDQTNWSSKTHYPYALKIWPGSQY